MKFELNQNQVKLFDTWSKEQNEVALEIQKENLSEEDFSLLTNDGEFAYYGAIGGGYTFSFTTSGIGTFCSVLNNVTYQKLDLNDYDSF